MEVVPFHDAVPRWVLLTVAGICLVVAGVRWEHLATLGRRGWGRLHDLAEGRRRRVETSVDRVATCVGPEATGWSRLSIQPTEVSIQPTEGSIQQGRRADP